MTDLLFVGTALIGFAIVGGSYLLGQHIQAKAQTDREKIEQQFEKRYTDVKREADQWRLAYEEARIEASRLRNRLNLQNKIYGKQKVRDLKHGN